MIEFRAAYDLHRLAEQADAVLIYSYGKPESDVDVKQAILALLDDLQKAHRFIGSITPDEWAAIDKAREAAGFPNPVEAAERRVAALTDALASAEARVSGLEEGLRALDEPLQWLNAHYHKAFVEMPTYIYRRIDKARALLTSGEPEGPAAPPANRHGGAIRVPVVVEWTSDEAYLRGWTEARALVDLNQMASVLAHYDITDTDWERLQTVLRGPVSETSDD